MPELPEVETIKRGLRSYVVGHTIEDVEIRAPGIFEGNVRDVTGAKVTNVRRLGKGLILELSNGNSLAIHIKLTGQLVYRGEETRDVQLSDKVGELPGKFTHVIFELDKNAKLYYNDQRRFGWIKVVPTEKVLSLPFFKTIGSEPPVEKGSHERELSLDDFKKLVHDKTTKIKPLIMDQTKIGGIGNIYANDALFLAKIDPRRPAKELDDEEAERLYKSILAVMEKGFKYGGASELSFVNVLGQTGEYQRHSLVYAKKGKPCPNCGTPIEFIKLAGRGTFFCSICQK